MHSSFLELEAFRGVVNEVYFAFQVLLVFSVCGELRVVYTAFVFTIILLLHIIRLKIQKGEGIID